MYSSYNLLTSSFKLSSISACVLSDLSRIDKFGSQLQSTQGSPGTNFPFKPAVCAQFERKQGASTTSCQSGFAGKALECPGCWMPTERTTEECCRRRKL